MEEQTTQPWEQQEHETDKAFSAFRLYREMPLHERSVREAYIRYRQMKEPNFTGEGIRRIPGYFSRWATDYDWRARMIPLDRQRDEIVLEEFAVGEHLEQLRDFRARLVEYSKTSTLAAIRGMKVVIRSLEAIEDENGGVIPPKDLAKFVTATAKLFESAADTEARAIAVDHLLEAVENGSPNTVH